MTDQGPRIALRVRSSYALDPLGGRMTWSGFHGSARRYPTEGVDAA